MSIKVTLKGFVHHVTEVKNSTSANSGKSFKQQSIVVKVPGWTNQFQEKVGDDEFWQLDAFNDHIDKHNLNQTMIGKKIEVTAYLNSRTYKKDGQDAYMISARLNDYKLF